MLADNAVTLAPAGSTGTGRKSAPGVSHAPRMAIEVAVEAVGGTPTMTFTLQGLLPGGVIATATDWIDLAYLDGDATVATSKAAIVVTAVGRTVKYLDGLDLRFFDAVAINITANTNVTFHASVYPVQRQ
jgi:hypothetical protein